MGADGLGTVRVAFRTLGCRLNQVDTEGMKAVLGPGMLVVGWQEGADVYVLNSCTVTGKADQECRRLARQIKRARPESRVVVTGCYAQTQPERLGRVEEIDGVLGVADREEIGPWLRELLAGGPRVRVSPFGARPPFAGPTIRSFHGRSRPYVKVQDGCDLRCSYCAIRIARGPARSRPATEVARQLAALAAGGTREVVLAGVHLGSWGRDLDPPRRLPDLLREVLPSCPGLRVRLGSLHPDELDPELLELLAAGGPLRPHVHLSLQSGSDAVLRRMRRPYGAERARGALADLAAAMPGAGLGADLIVGFPGESEADFEATLALVREGPLNYLHVFRFSPRPGTPAAAFADPVPAPVAAERSERLREAGERQAERFARGLLGAWREAVLESTAGPAGRREATTDNYVGVLVPAVAPAGTLVRLRPDRWEGGRLWADACEPLAALPAPAPSVAPEVAP